MREGVCTLQEGIEGSEVSLLEMASQNPSSLRNFFRCGSSILRQRASAEARRRSSSSEPHLPERLRRENTVQVSVQLLDRFQGPHAPCGLLGKGTKLPGELS